MLVGCHPCHHGNTFAAGCMIVFELHHRGAGNVKRPYALATSLQKLSMAFYGTPVRYHYGISMDITGRRGTSVQKQDSAQSHTQTGPPDCPYRFLPGASLKWMGFSSKPWMLRLKSCPRVRLARCLTRKLLHHMARIRRCNTGQEHLKRAFGRR